jgi:hypothetical protein
VTQQIAAIRGIAALAAAFACALLGADHAAANTQLVSRTPSGLMPNGPSANASLAQDRRGASLLAYESSGSDIVPGDTNGLSDVFVVRRARPFNPRARKATRWVPGATELVSTGLGGAPADGASYGADLDGSQRHNAHCVAFVSQATNLVAGDTNGKADAFVKDLRSGQITRVSVNSAGEQADGDVFDVEVDGACDRVAFSSNATNLALTQTPKPRIVNSALTGAQRRRCRARFRGNRRAQRRRCKTRRLKVRSQRAPAVTTQPAPGTTQVYVRILGGQPDDAGIVGLTFLASASSSGEAGNDDSYDVSFGELSGGCPETCGSTSGDALAFTSEASNLTGGDGNGVPDVYRRSFKIPPATFVQRRARIPAYMEMRTDLVSSKRSGLAGNGASDQPSINDDGDVVVFRTAASDLLPGDGNGVTDIARALTVSSPPRLTRVSFARAGGIQGNGGSSQPSSSRAGSPILFQTDADNLSALPTPDRNCTGDVVFWHRSNSRLATKSTDSDGVIAGGPPSPTTDPCPANPTTPAENPVSSAQANYVAFEDSHPLIDLPVADRMFPGLRNDPAQASQKAHSEPALHQVYIHFIGP